MVVDAVQSYLDLAASLRRAGRARAAATARLLLGQAGLGDAADEAGERFSKLTDELQQARRANRELAQKLVATEVDKAAARWGFVRSDDLEALREEVDELRRTLVRTTVDLGDDPAPTSTRGRPTPAAPTPPTAPQPPLGGAPDAPGFPDDPGLFDDADMAPVGAEPSSADEVSVSPIPTPVKRPAPAKKATRATTTVDDTTAPEPAKKTAAKKTPAKKTADSKAASKKTAGGSAAGETSPSKTSPSQATSPVPSSSGGFETVLPTPAPPLSVPPSTPEHVTAPDPSSSPSDAEALE